MTFRNKGLHYLGGLTEGFETIVVFVAMCLWPGGFAAIREVCARRGGAERGSA